MKDSELLILLDFDSLIYNKSKWRIINPMLGRVGSTIELVSILNLYLEKKDKKFNIFDNFIPDVLDIPLITNQKVSDLDVDIMPIQKLNEVIIQHRIRGRKIYYLTMIFDPKIKEYILNCILKYTKIDPYFYDLPWLEYWTPPMTNSIKSFEFPQFIKMIYIKKFIKKINQDITPEEKFDFRDKYKRIFYYTTDLAIMQLLKNFIKENSSDYEYKQNSIISYMIANVLEN